MFHARFFTPLLVSGLVACPVADPGDDDDSGEQEGGLAPVVSSVQLEPSFAHTDDLLTATTEAMDPDGDAWTVTHTWYSGDEPIAEAPDQSTLDGDVFFERGERISVEVFATDETGRTSSSVRSTSVEVLNSAPGVPGLAITAAPAAGVTDIVCSVAVDSSDADGDAVTYRFRWERDFVSWDGSVGTTTHDADTLPGAETRSGDVWGCHVVATDGLDDASEVTTSVTVP